MFAKNTTIESTPRVCLSRPVLGVGRLIWRRLGPLSLSLAVGLVLLETLACTGEFRIVDWNAAGSDPDWNKGKDTEVADFVLGKVKSINANVITLQEVTDTTYSRLKKQLTRRWDCHFQRFGVDGIATCVKGRAANFQWKRLSGERWGPEIDWWGYIQLEYNGLKITNVHTRAHWADQHLAELHKDVKTGIVAGDFNHTNPGWHQTDLDLEPTWQDKKIDHVLMVEKPQRAWGDAQEKGGSNHRVLLTGVTPP